MWKLIAAIAASLMLTAVAGAAVTPTGYWTPKQAAAVLGQRGNDSDRQPRSRVWVATRREGDVLSYPFALISADEWPGAPGARCAGVGKQAAGATFAAFRCNLILRLKEGPSTVAVFARIWSDGRKLNPHLPHLRTPGESLACISARTIAECPPAPAGPMLPGDPRELCGPGAGACMERTAWSETKKAFSLETSRETNLQCLASATFVYHCTWASGAADVAFVRGAKSWSTKVTAAS